jgi:hypothetical protein
MREHIHACEDHCLPNMVKYRFNEGRVPPFMEDK